MSTWKKNIILAMDVSLEKDIDSYFSLFSGHIQTVKIGKQIFTRYGPDIIKKAHDNGFQVFLDLKYHDIPNTVKNAVIEATQLGVAMMTVHCSGGLVMLQNAYDGALLASKEHKKPVPLILGVTVLTSISQDILNSELGIQGTIPECVNRFALLAKQAGLGGVVASPQEISIIKNSCGKDLAVVTPGIRPLWSQKGDQKRIMTPREAITKGADYLVIGRAITAQPDPIDAFYRIVDEIEEE